MSGRAILLWILIPFVGLCALALWLTRPSSPPPGPIATREEQASPPAVPRIPAPPPLASPSRPDGQAPLPSGSPSEAPPAPARPSIPSAGSTLPSRVPPPAPITVPEAEPRTQDSEGMVDKEEIRRAIQTVVPLIRQCFLDVAERYPGPQTVTLKFTIEGQGLTGHFKDGEVVDTTLQDPFALACFLDSLLDVRFPPPRGGGTVTITYPFRFEPQADAGR